MSSFQPTPYKGLDWFTEWDQDDFAGRERDVSEIIAKLVGQRALILYGRSGVGKTSLLCAGVFPALRDRGWIPVKVRVLGDGVLDLVVGLREYLNVPRRGNGAMSVPAGPVWVPEPAAEATEDDIVKFVAELMQRVAPNSPLLLAFDQFEEVLIRRNEALQELAKRNLSLTEHIARRRLMLQQHQRFVQIVLGLVRVSEMNIRVLFSLREDYLAAVDEFERAMPGLLAEAWRVMPLTAYAAREAIVRPLIRRNLRYSDRLVSRVVDELSLFDFDSARLQLACEQICQEAGEPAPASDADGANGSVFELKEEHFKTASHGGWTLHEVYRRFLQRAVAQVEKDTSQSALSRLALHALLTSDRTKNAMTAEEVEEQVTGQNPRFTERLQQVLEALTKARVLRRFSRGVSSQDQQNTWYELAHDCLGDPVRDWVNSDDKVKDFQRTRDELRLRTAKNWRNKSRELFRAREIEKLRDYRDFLGLENQPEQLCFLAHSSAWEGDAELWKWLRENFSGAGKSPWIEALTEALQAQESVRDERARLNVLRLIAEVPGPFGSAEEVARLSNTLWLIASTTKIDEIRQVARDASVALDREGYRRRIVEASSLLATVGSTLKFWKKPTNIQELSGLEPAQTWQKESFLHRWSFRRNRWRSMKRLHAEEIQASTQSASLAAAFAVVLTALVGGGLFGCMVGWLPHPLHRTRGMEMELWAVIWAGMIAFGAILAGRWIAKRAAILRWTDPEIRARSVVGSSKVVLFAFAAFSGPLWAALADETSWLSDIDKFLDSTGLAVVAFGIAGLLSALPARRLLAECVNVSWIACRISRTRVETVAWSIGWLLVFGVVAPLAFVSWILPRLDPGTWDFSDANIWFVIGLILTGSLFVVSTVGITVAWKDYSPQPARWNAPRVFLLSSAAAGIVWIFVVYGADFVFGIPQDWDGKTKQSTAPRWPGRDYIRIDPDEQVLNVRQLDGALIEVGGQGIDKSGLVLLSPGVNRLAIETPWDKSPGDPVILELLKIQTAPPPNLVAHENYIWRLPLSRVIRQPDSYQETQEARTKGALVATSYEGLIGGQVQSGFSNEKWIVRLAVGFDRGAENFGPDELLRRAKSSYVSSDRGARGFSPYGGALRISSAAGRLDRLSAVPGELVSFTVEERSWSRSRTQLANPETWADGNAFSLTLPINPSNGTWNVRLEGRTSAQVTNEYLPLLISTSLQEADFNDLVDLAAQFLQRTNDALAARYLENAMQVVTNDVPLSQPSALIRQLASAMNAAGANTNLSLPLAEISVSVFPRLSKSLSSWNAQDLNSLAWKIVHLPGGARAYPLARRAVELEPGSAEKLDTLAHAAYEAKDWPAAVAAWDKSNALRKGPWRETECRDDDEKLRTARANAGPAR